jgi:hypothetical protein
MHVQTAEIFFWINILCIRENAKDEQCHEFIKSPSVQSGVEG